MLYELVQKNRSYRRFYQNERIDDETLRQLIELARFSASTSNLQPLRFCIVNDPEKNDEVFGTLKWAGYYKDWDGPEEGERPSAYIVILRDKNVSVRIGYDEGIAAQSMMLGAAEKGLGGCMVGSIDVSKLREILNIDDGLSIQLVLALGRPKEKAVAQTVKNGESIKYWRDNDGVQHVPKRAAQDIIVGL